jgi:hypothetical protein
MRHRIGITAQLRCSRGHRGTLRCCRPLLLASVAVLGTGLTACMRLPPAVASEMRPAVPPAANHYRQPQAPAAALQHAESVP